MPTSDDDEMNAFQLHDRGAFIDAFNVHSRDAIKKLQELAADKPNESEEARRIQGWAAVYGIGAIWMLEITRKTLACWRMNPQIAASGRLNLPGMPMARPSAAPLRVEVPGYEDPLETPEAAKERMLKMVSAEIDAQLQNAPPKPERRHRDGRHPDCRFQWLAMSLEPHRTLAQIAKQVEMDPRNLRRAIDKARTDLGFPLERRRRGPLPMTLPAPSPETTYRKKAPK